MKNESINLDILKTREAMDSVLSDIDWKKNKKDRIIGTSTGFIEIDNLLGGLQGGKLYCLAGRPGMGKSSFALNISLHLALSQHVNTVIFSLEDSTKRILSRMLPIRSRVDSSAIGIGDLNDFERKKVEEAAEDISHAPLAVIDDCYELEEIEHKCLDMFWDGSDGLIVIDYLQLITVGNMIKASWKKCNTREQISCIIRRLKLLAKRINVPIIVLSQISNRMKNRMDNRPLLCDFMVREVVIFSDVVLFIYRDDYYNPESFNPGVAEIIIAKNHDGPTGIIELVWLQKYQQFANLIKDSCR